ncbi:MAG TPA: hypothetical protein GXZ27_09130 [Thermoanaerobacterales bacterium]|jgi:hypothetical protein|nr:hypothetical protein [Thermoanaerobacterales bacterium]
MGEIDVFAELSDMKMVDYKNTLAIVSLIEVLTEKGVIDNNDIAIKAKTLDLITEHKIKSRTI